MGSIRSGSGSGSGQGPRLLGYTSERIAGTRGEREKSARGAQAREEHNRNTGTRGTRAREDRERSISTTGVREEEECERAREEDERSTTTRRPRDQNEKMILSARGAHEYLHEHERSVRGLR